MSEPAATAKSKTLVLYEHDGESFSSNKFELDYSQVGKVSFGADGDFEFKKATTFTNEIYVTNPAVTVVDPVTGEVSAPAFPVAVFLKDLGHGITSNAQAIADEAKNRQSDDVDLQGAIDSETSAREDADTTLQNNIYAEAADRAAADTTLQNNINSEETARIAEDAKLQNNIDTLQSNINTEATARAAADTVETNARAAADTTLQANIDAEETDRKAEDAKLQNNIDAEATTRAAEDATLQSNIDAEATARAADDTKLQANIDAEEADRKAEDAKLQANIDDLQSQINNILSNSDPATLDSLTEIVAAFNAADNDVLGLVTALTARVDALTGS